MITAADQNPSNVASEQFSSEVPGSAGCTSAPNKSLSPPTYVFPENFFVPNQDTGSTQPFLESYGDGHADKWDSLRMNTAFKYNPLLDNTLSCSLVAPDATEVPSGINSSANAPTPCFDSYAYNHKPSNFHHPSHLQTGWQAQPIAPVAMNMVSLRARRNCWPYVTDKCHPTSATAAHQNSSTMTLGTVPSLIGAAPYSNQGFNLMSMPENVHSFNNSSVHAPFNHHFSYPYSNFDTQHTNSTPVVASNAPVVRVNVEYPLNQPTSSSFQVQQPMQYLSNDCAQGMLQSYNNYEWKYPLQTADCGSTMGPSVPVVFDSQGYYMKNGDARETQDMPQHTFYDQYGMINNAEIGDASSISATQSKVPSSASRGKEELCSPRKRRRELSSPNTPSSSSPGPSTAPADSGSKRDRGTPFICRWEGCNQELPSDTTKLSYSHHLDRCHGFRGNTDTTIMECKWTEPGSEPGTVCKCMERLQKQSVIKHTAGKHLKLMVADCPLCGSSQARGDNMFRHFKTCVEFRGLGDEEKKEIWEDHTVQSFDEYLDSERARLERTGRKRRRVSKGMKKQKL